jgi:hypothetical protein
LGKSFRRDTAKRKSESGFILTQQTNLVKIKVGWGKCERCQKNKASTSITATLEHRSYQLCEDCHKKWAKIWRERVDNQNHRGKYYRGYEEKFEDEFLTFLNSVKVKVILI